MLDFFLPTLGAIAGGVITAVITHQLAMRKLRQEHAYDLLERELVKKRDALAKFLGVPGRNIGEAVANASTMDDDMQLREHFRPLRDTAVEVRPLFQGSDQVQRALTSLGELPTHSLGAKDRGEAQLSHKAYMQDVKVLNDELTRLEAAISTLYAPKRRNWKFWQRAGNARKKDDA